MEKIQEPIIRKVKDGGGRILHLTLNEYCWCYKCKRVRACLYSSETPDEHAYWECGECGNTDLILNGYTQEWINENNMEAVNE